MNNSRLNRIENWPELTRRANWSVSALAKLCGVSEDTLRRHFRRHMDKTPKVWLSGQRQQQALELLRDGCSIKQTAACLGYKQQTNFTRKFKEFWGVCPSLPPTVSLVPAQTAGK
jgi:AraC-like DNA-binding protein